MEQIQARNIKLIYLHEVFFAAADGMLSIGTVVFLYQFFGSIAAVFLWNLCWNVPHFLIFIPVVNLVLKCKRPLQSMMTGLICKLFAIILLVEAGPGETLQVFAAAGLIALHVSLYWPLRRWFFAVNISSNSVGKQVSNLVIIKLVVGFLSPAIGGAIGCLFGVDKTLYGGALFMFLAMIPIALYRLDFEILKTAPCGPKDIFSNADLQKVRSAYFARGLTQYVADLTWRLAFVVFVGSIGSLGFITGASTLLGALLSKAVGRSFDGRNRAALLRLSTLSRVTGTFLLSLVCFHTGLVFVLSLQVLNKFTQLVHGTVMDSYLYSYSKAVRPIAFLLNREFFISSGRIISSAVLAGVFSIASPVMLWYVLAIGSLAYIGHFKLARVDYLIGDSEEYVPTRAEPLQA
jgi:hypothetical protein